jgi:hypothetical protein
MFVYCTNAASFFAYLKIQLSAQQAKCKQKTYISARGYELILFKELI